VTCSGRWRPAWPALGCPGVGAWVARWLGSERGCLACVGCAVQVVQQVAGRVSSTAPGEGHKQPVLYVAGHDTAPLLATASKDKTIKIWSAEPPADAAAV